MDVGELSGFWAWIKSNATAIAAIFAAISAGVAWRNTFIANRQLQLQNAPSFMNKSESTNYFQG